MNFIVKFSAMMDLLTHQIMILLRMKLRVSMNQNKFYPDLLTIQDNEESIDFLKSNKAIGFDKIGAEMIKFGKSDILIIFLYKFAEF